MRVPGSARFWELAWRVLFLAYIVIWLATASEWLEFALAGILILVFIWTALVWRRIRRDGRPVNESDVPNLAIFGLLGFGAVVVLIDAALPETDLAARITGCILALGLIAVMMGELARRQERRGPD